MLLISYIFRRKKFHVFGITILLTCNIINSVIQKLFIQNIWQITQHSFVIYCNRIVSENFV